MNLNALIRPVARIGFAALGLVYVVIGALALGAASGQAGGRTTDARGAVDEVGRLWEGGILLIVLALGLASYAVWRFAQAILDLDDVGGGFKGWATRAGFFTSGLVHFGLAMTAAGIGATSGSGSKRVWVARALAKPGGLWAVGLVGVIVMGAGLLQFYTAWTVEFEKQLEVNKMPASVQTWARRIGRFGLAARGVTFLIVGWFLVRAAINVTAGEVKDMGGALQVVGAQAYGAWLLAIVACGTISYGLLSFVAARYRRITSG